MSKEEKEQTSQRKHLLVAMPEVGASVWKLSSAPPEDGLSLKKNNNLQTPALNGRDEDRPNQGQMDQISSLSFCHPAFL